MDDFHKTLMESFISEVDSVIVEMGSIFNKNTIDASNIQVVFRAFHNIKSNARLLEYHSLSSSSAIGEEVCREILKKNVPANSEILNCLRTIYDHASYIFECIKVNKTEPAISGLDYNSIKNVIYGVSYPESIEKYSKKELEYFSIIIATHFSNSLGQRDGVSLNAIRHSIILIKESAALLEFTQLEQNYKVLCELLEQGIARTDKQWIDMTSQIIAELKKIEIDNYFDKQLVPGECHG